VFQDWPLRQTFLQYAHHSVPGVCTPLVLTHALVLVCFDVPEVGPIKWGIAKVLANAEKPPILMAWYQLGMEQIFPQTSDNEIISSVPRVGKHVTVQFGDPIEYEDLIRAYHRGAARRARERAARRAEIHKATPGVKGEGKAAEADATKFPHIDPSAPVLEACVPPSRFRLRIVPPDHQILTPAELVEEEAIRLKLYSAISDRIGDGLRLLEDQVRDRRRQQGHEKLDDKQW